MTDSLNETGAFAPAQSLASDEQVAFTPASAEFLDAQNPISADAEQVQDAEPALPNGFLTLALAPELVKACIDLGYTQPTAVQTKVIPLALPTEMAGKGSGQYIDLMVSSQTGSGKTAAFLLPVLHTLLAQMAQAEEEERRAYEEAVAQAAAKGSPT